MLSPSPTLISSRFSSPTKGVPFSTPTRHTSPNSPITRGWLAQEDECRAEDIQAFEKRSLFGDLIQGISRSLFSKPERLATDTRSCGQVCSGSPRQGSPPPIGGPSNSQGSNNGGGGGCGLVSGEMFGERSAIVDERDRDVQNLQGSYWYSAPRSLVAFRHMANEEPEEVAHQTVWWIQRAEQRFLFGYVWELTSDVEAVRVRRLTITFAPDSSVQICMYGDPSKPTVAHGTFDRRRFVLHVTESDLVYWAQMVMAQDLDRQLAGCTVSINHLIQLRPVPESVNDDEDIGASGLLQSCSTQCCTLNLAMTGPPRRNHFSNEDTPVAT